MATDSGERKTRDAARNRTRQARLKAAGLCVQCGRQPAGAGKTKCRECADKAIASFRAYREANADSINSKRRGTDLTRKYNLSEEDYTALLAAQGGVCRICGGTNSDRRLAVDHCHDTGKVRGLLCGNCNTGLGKFRDTTVLLRRAIDYLEAA